MPTDQNCWTCKFNCEAVKSQEEGKFFDWLPWPGSGTPSSCNSNDTKSAYRWSNGQGEDFFDDDYMPPRETTPCPSWHQQ